MDNIGTGTISPPFSCGSSIIINHVTGAVAPVTKTVTYGTVTNIPGETSKCWITSNLGADHQATSVDDATEESAGWYWQFNRMQGFKHDGTTRTPNTTWITSINENSDWLTANDPCTLLLGSGWRLPSKTEWINVDESGNWDEWNGPWNSALKIHAAGSVSHDLCNDRGSLGFYWSSSQNPYYNGTTGFILFFGSGGCVVHGYDTKTIGYSCRCLLD